MPVYEREVGSSGRAVGRNATILSVKNTSGIGRGAVGNRRSVADAVVARKREPVSKCAGRVKLEGRVSLGVFNALYDRIELVGEQDGGRRLSYLGRDEAMSNTTRGGPAVGR